jgi:hypothetical protein
MIEWGPWIEHDGAAPEPPHGVGWKLDTVSVGLALRHPPACGIGPGWPGFYWRWRRVRVGWFRTELRRVCDDPAYAPIIRYRIGRPRGNATMRRLQQIAQGLRPVEGPEGPVRTREVVE